MRTLILALGLTLISTAARADVTYETIDSYTAVEEGQVEITGVQQGKSVATTDFYFYYFNYNGNHDGMSKRCDALATVMILKPGKFYFKLIDGGSNVSRCSLIKR